MDTFEALDKNQKGYILPTKLLTAMRIFGFEVTSAVIDRSKGGDKIGLNEFMSFMLSSASSQEKWHLSEMKDLFRGMDRENVGFITDSQVQRILSRFGEHLKSTEVEFELGQYFMRQNHQIEFDSFIMLLSEAP